MSEDRYYRWRELNEAYTFSLRAELHNALDGLTSTFERDDAIGARSLKNFLATNENSLDDLGTSLKTLQELSLASPEQLDARVLATKRAMAQRWKRVASSSAVEHGAKRMFTTYALDVYQWLDGYAKRRKEDHTNLDRSSTEMERPEGLKRVATAAELQSLAEQLTPAGKDDDAKPKAA